MADLETILRGFVATSDRDSKLHPEAWRRKVYKILPVGDAPLTAFLQAMGSEPTPSRHMHWFEQQYPEQRGSVTDVYTDVALSSAYASGGVVGSALYLNMPEADAKQIVAGNMLTIFAPNTPGAMITCDVRNVSIGNDATTWVLVELLEADTNSILADATLTFAITGDARAEGSGLPAPTGRDPVELSNQTQIFMEAVSWTGTEREEEQRIDGTYPQQQLWSGFNRFRLKMERALIFGQYATKQENGKPKRFTRGFRAALAQHAPNRFYNYKTDSDFSGQDWLVGGWSWFAEKILLETSELSSGRKRLLCGDLLALAIEQLVEDRGLALLESRETSFGFRYKTIRGLTTEVDLIIHPDFRRNAALKRSGMLIENRLLRLRPMRRRDVTFIPASQLKDKEKNGWTWVDGDKAGWYCEAGLEYDNLAAMAWLDGAGLLNTA